MNCSNISSFVWDYLEDSLDHSFRHEFDTHLSTCSSCREMVSEIKKFDLIIKESKDVQPDPFLSTRIIGRLESSTSGAQQRGSFKPALYPYLIMIVLALIIGFTSGIYVATGRQNKASGLVAQKQEIQLLRSELFISDLLDEEKLIFQNSNP